MLFLEIMVILITVCFILYLFGCDKFLSVFYSLILCMLGIVGIIVGIGFLFGYGIKLAGG